MVDKRPLLALLLVAIFLGGGFWLTNNSSASSPSDDPGIEVVSTATTKWPNGSSLQATGSNADWAAGLKRVTDLENAAFQNPDPSKVGQFMTPICTCYKDTVTRLTQLQSAGRRVAGANITLTDVAFVREQANRVVIFTAPKPAGFPVVDGKGTTVETSPTAPGLPFLYTLEKGSDGQWRIADRSVAKEQS